jgi:hypothetical protein
LVAAVCVGAGILAAFLVLRPPAVREQEVEDEERMSSELAEPIAQAA